MANGNKKYAKKTGYKKKYSAYNKKKKKSVYKTAGCTVQVGRSPISTSQIVRMRYVQRVNLDPIVTNAGTYVFSASGITRPDVTTTNGHRPISFDEWMIFYNHYVVLGSKMTCQFSHINGTTAGQQDMMVGLQLKAGNNIDTTDIDTILEQGKTKYKLLSRTGDKNTSVNVSKTFSTSKFFGISPAEVQDSLYRGSNTSNPSEQAYYHCVAMSTDSSSNAPNIILLVTIDYVVKFTERKPLVGSIIPV